MPEVMAEAGSYAKAAGGSITVTDQLDQALAGSRVIYAKAWGPATSSGLGPDAVKAHPEWLTSPAHLAKAATDAIFLHCLPVRRNVEVSDGVLDSTACRVVDEAENRFHVQRALLDLLLNS
jgi:N-acetylornithine carbamoyltransferase